MKAWWPGISALIIGALASGCGGGSGGFASDAGSLQLPDTDPSAARCNLSPEVCEIVPVYDNGEADRLILSHDGLDAVFFAGPIMTARAQGEAENAGAMGADGVMDSDTFYKAAGNRLVIAGVELPLDEASVSQERLAYCNPENCLRDYSVTPLGYDYYVRYPGLVQRKARDISLAKFTVIKTARSNDHIVFGVAATMDFKRFRRGPDEEVTITVRSLIDRRTGLPVSREDQQNLDPNDPDDAIEINNHVIAERVTTYNIPSTINVYQAEQLGAFVSGPRFVPPSEKPLALGGRAAYLGFANAYAHSSNKNFLPFRPANGREGDSMSSTRTVERGGSNFGSGHAAMVFKFDAGGASFESGYLDLAGPSYVDQGALVRRGGPVTGGLIPDDPVANAFFVDPAGRFANPDFADVHIGGNSGNFRERYQILDRFNQPYDIEMAIRNRISAGPFAYEPNPDGEFEIGGQAGSGPGQSSGLAFSLFPNEATEDRMDFTMQLVLTHNLPGGSLGPCYTAMSQGIACQPRKRYDPDDPEPLGAGVVRFYGGLVELDNNVDLGNGAPTFAAGVWRFNELVYLGMGESSGYDNDEELVAIVDLIGTIGGLVYDADPGPPPSSP